MQSTAILELRRHSWDTLRTAKGAASSVPGAVEGLLLAATEDDCTKYYWQLENTVVVQGTLYESALYLVPVLCAALTDDLSGEARKWVLELLFQIVSGEAGDTEKDHDLFNLGELCRKSAQEGLWSIYKELTSGYVEIARDILELVDPNKERYETFLDAASRRLMKRANRMKNE